MSLREVIGNLASGAKLAFAGIRYPALTALVDDVMSFYNAVFKDFKLDEKAKAKAIENIKKIVEDLQGKEDIDEEDFKKAFSDVILQVAKVAGKHVKASKFDEGKGMLGIVLKDENKTYTIIIKAKVVENE